MIAVDLDGTLLDSRGRVSDANAAALQRAHDAGALVVPCTGRGWRESHSALGVFAHNGTAPGVFVGGALVSDFVTGEPLEIAALEPTLAMRIVEHLFDQPEALLLYRSAHHVGHDYLVTGTGALSANTRWWFEATEALVHENREPTLEDMHHTMRVGLVATEDRMAQIIRLVREAFHDDEAFVHAFGGVTEAVVERAIHVLEVFAPNVDKWRGLSWLARQHGIESAEVAVIGDQINDIAMVREAGCGVAMANAVPALRDIADRHTGHCNESGVAQAIDALLSGQWD